MEARVLEALEEEEMKSRNRCWASRMYHQSANLLSVSQSVKEPVSISVGQSVSQSVSPMNACHFAPCRVTNFSFSSICVIGTVRPAPGPLLSRTRT